MTFVQGFLTPVPTANKATYLEHSTAAVPLFQSFGAGRLVEAWGDSVPDGKVNDLKRAVALTPDETLLFSWVEYPDKATHDAANERMASDPALAELGEMPFDGMRMMWGGFETLLDTGAPADGTPPGYIDGIVLAVPEESKADYLALSERTAAIFRDYGALRVVENWGEPIPDGKVTDFNRATLRKDGERVVFSWIEWPSKQVHDDAWPKLMQDPRMQNDGAPPFDGQRMMWGGFAPLLDSGSM